MCYVFLVYYWIACHSLKFYAGTVVQIDLTSPNLITLSLTLFSDVANKIHFETLCLFINWSVGLG